MSMPRLIALAKYKQRSMALGSSSCRYMRLFVVSAVGAAGCVAFHSPRHLGACDMMMQCHYTKLNVKCDEHQEEGDSQHWHISIAAASVLLLGGAYTANAFDMPSSFAIIQPVSPYKNSAQDAFQGFIPKTSRSIKFPSLVSSAQSASSTSTGTSTNIKPVAKTIENTVKDIPNAMQQTIANPAVSRTKSPLTAVTEKTPPKPSQPKPQSISSDKTTSQKPQNALQTTGVKKMVDENKVEVELICNDGQRPLDVTPPIVRIDRETFSKVKIYQPPKYLPSFVRQFQSVKVLKSIPSEQLFLASVFAGSLTEMIRTCLLYPLSTVKARVQARTVRGTNRKRPLLRKLRVTWLTFLYETKRGDWYAGLLPTILVTVPASGVYSGAKEVSRRAFSMAIQFQVIQNLFPGDAAASSYYSALVVNLLAAFVADIAALAIRIPADVLALRLQVFGDNNVKSDYTDWAKDSLALLPAMLLTDIPFLLSRIFLNAAIMTSGENLGRYEFETIVIACLCAFLTTPFDVARTRILLPTLPSEEAKLEAKLDSELDDVKLKGEESETPKRRRLIASRKDRERRREKTSVPLTMRRIAQEGDGGVQNLYAGWLERTAFLGVGRAWLDPLRVLGYLGIRDALLLKLFD